MIVSLFRKTAKVFRHRRSFGLYQTKPENERTIRTPQQKLWKKSEFNPYRRIGQDTGKNPFGKASALAISTGSLNMAQGFPDFGLPEIGQKAYQQVFKQKSNEVVGSAGDPELLESFSKVVSKRLNKKIDPKTMIVTGTGCGGLYPTIAKTYLRRGDEAILFEPFFVWNNCLEYLDVKVKTGRDKLDKETNTMKLDVEHLRSLITPKTKMITLITPNNPSGKMWSRDELEAIRQICEENPQIFVLSDEVYCQFTYDQNEHIPFSSLKNMFERTFTLYSLGKEFCSTGWRVGAAVGPKDLIQPITEANRWQNICPASNSMVAFQHAYENSHLEYKGEKDYWTWLRKDFQWRRDRATQVVEEATKLGIDVIHSQGGYTFSGYITEGIKNVPIKYFYENFISPDSVPVNLNDKGGLTTFDDWKLLPNPVVTPDEAYCQWLSHEVGVTFIGGTAFYQNHNLSLNEKKGVDTIRVSLCKGEEAFTQMEKLFNE